MGKTKKFKIEVEEKPPRRGHQEHRSGAGNHDNREKRCRTRQKESEKWTRDFDK